MEEKLNIQKAIKAITALDTVLSGGWIGGMGSLIAYAINSIANDNASHTNKYVVETFNCFRLRKNTFRIDLVKINYFADVDETLVHSVLCKGDMIGGTDDDYDGEDLEDYEFTRRDSRDTTNLLRREFYGIFPNVKKLIIHTTDKEVNFCCTMSLLALLSSIKSTEITRIEIVAWRNDEKTWLDLLWGTSSKNLIAMYKAENYKISIRRSREKCKSGGGEWVSDRVVIKNMRR